MGSRAMILVGSPRAKSNTRMLAEWAAEGAREAGAEVEMVEAAQLKYGANGCTACNACQQAGDFRCVIDDEASPILARMAEADGILLATPVYFMGFSAQLKLLLDRMYSLVRIYHEENRIETPLKNTAFGLIATAGGDEGSGLALVEKNMQAIVGILGKHAETLLVPFAPPDGEALAARDDLRAQAAALGKKIAAAG